MTKTNMKIVNVDVRTSMTIEEVRSSLSECIADAGMNVATTMTLITAVMMMMVM